MTESTYSLDDLPERLAARIEPRSGCWHWLGTIRKVDRYGACSWEGRQHVTHRLIYALLVGPIPPGLVLDHLCSNRACVFPGHLEPVTMQENARRGGARRRRGECKHGHPLSGDNLGHTPSGHRFCKACNVDGKRRQRERYATDSEYRARRRDQKKARRRKLMTDPANRARIQQQQNEWRRKRYAIDPTYRARRLNRKSMPGRGDTQGSLF